MPDERIEKLLLDDFGLLDTSQFPDDVNPKRARECYDLIMSERGRVRSLSKRPGYQYVADNLAEYKATEAGSIEYGDNTKVFNAHHRNTIVFFPGKPDNFVWGHIYDSISGSKYKRIELYYTNDGGATSSGPFYFTTNASIIYTTSSPYIDFELSYFDGYIYIMFEYHSPDDDSGGWRFIKMAWNEFLTGTGDKTADSTLIDGASWAPAAGPNKQYDMVSCVSHDTYGVYVSYTYLTSGDYQQILKYYDGSTIQATTSFEAIGEDYINGLLRFEGDVLYFMYYHDIELEQSYTSDLTGISSWTTNTVLSSDIDLTTGFSYRIASQSIMGSFANHIILYKNSSNVLTFAIIKVGLSITPYAVQSTNVYHKFDFVVLQRSLPKARTWFLVYYHEGSGLVTEDYVRSKLLAYDESSFRSERIVLAFDESDSDKNEIYGVNAAAYMDGVETPEWQVKFMASAYAQNAAADSSHSIVVSDFKTITIEALTDDWFEEDGKLQMTCQADDNILRKWIFSTTPESVYWELLENVLSNVYATGGGRFRSDSGVIRMSNDKLSTTKPVWYGYVKQDYFDDPDETPEYSVEGRFVYDGNLAAPILSTNIDTSTIRGYIYNGVDAKLPGGRYRFRFFYQYDNIQYSRLSDDYIEKDIGAEYNGATGTNWHGLTFFMTITNAIESAQNKRISGIGVAVLHIPAADDALDAQDLGTYNILGIIPMGLGDRSPLAVGNATYVNAATDYLDMQNGDPPLTVGAATQFFYATTEDLGAYVKLTSSSGTVTHHRFASEIGSFQYELEDAVSGSGDTASLTPGNAYDYEVYSLWEYNSVDDTASHIVALLTPSLLQSFNDISGFSENLKSISAHYRDRCSVNNRSFFTGVMYDPGGDNEETFDDTVFYGPQTGDGFYTQDVVDPSKYLTFGRGDGDNVARIVSHGIGSDAAGTASTELLVIFKRTRIYVVDVTGSPVNWNVVRKYEGVGLVGRDALLQVQGSIFFMDKQGLMELRGLELKEASGWRRLDGYTRSFSDTEVRNCIIGYVGTRDWVLVMYPTRSTYRIFCYDRQFDEWSEFRFDDTPSIVAVGHGDSARIAGISGRDLNERLLFSDGETVWAFPAFTLTTDDGTNFAGRWLSDGKGSETPLTQFIIHNAGVAHFTQGANGTLSILRETGAAVLSVTLTAGTPGNVPTLATKRALNARANSIGIQFDAAAAATRSDLDAVEIELERVRKIL